MFGYEHIEMNGAGKGTLGISIASAHFEQIP